MERMSRPAIRGHRSRRDGRARPLFTFLRPVADLLAKQGVPGPTKRTFSAAKHEVAVLTYHFRKVLEVPEVALPRIPCPEQAAEGESAETVTGAPHRWNGRALEVRAWSECYLL